jgi:hypothetical protein
MTAFTHLVTAQIVNDQDAQVGTSMIDLAWDRPPHDRAEANRWMQEITEQEWKSGGLARHHRYRIAAWSEYAR